MQDAMPFPQGHTGRAHGRPGSLADQPGSCLAALFLMWGGVAAAMSTEGKPRCASAREARGKRVKGEGEEARGWGEGEGAGRTDFVPTAYRHVD